MTIIASITNNSGAGIAFETTTGGTMVANGATATLTLPDAAMTALRGYQASGACSVTFTQLSDAMPIPFVVGREQIAGTTYTLSNADNGCILEATNASGCAFTFPATLNRGFNVGILRYGAGAVTWVAGSGATIRVPSSATAIAAQYGLASAYVRANTNGSNAEIVIAGNVS
jgi:hypothetical protein